MPLVVDTSVDDELYTSSPTRLAVGGSEPCFQVRGGPVWAMTDHSGVSSNKVIIQEFFVTWYDISYCGQGRLLTGNNKPLRCVMAHWTEVVDGSRGSLQTLFAHKLVPG
jgi:hypothetical protein